jgi:hypothetical protein
MQSLPAFVFITQLLAALHWPLADIHTQVFTFLTALDGLHFLHQLHDVVVSFPPFIATSIDLFRVLTEFGTQLGACPFQSRTAWSFCVLLLQFR